MTLETRLGVRGDKTFSILDELNLGPSYFKSCALNHTTRLSPRPALESNNELKSAIRINAVTSLVTGSRWTPRGVRSNTIDASGIGWAVVSIRMTFVEI